MRDASHGCLDAAGRFVLACVQSLGLMVSNPAWQATLVGPTSHGRNIEVTLELCGQFPDEYRRECLIGAVDNIMNFDGVALDRALRFCRATDGPDREPCYRRIGFAIGVQVVEPQGRWDLCLEVDEPYQTACADAAGIEVIQGGQAVLRPESSDGAQVRRVVGSATPASTPCLSAKPEGNAPTVAAPSRRTIVVWSNEDDGLMWLASDDHPTHEGYPGFDARRPIVSGASWSFTFGRVGVWGYHNHMAPRAEGQVIVQE